MYSAVQYIYMYEYIQYYVHTYMLSSTQHKIKLAIFFASKHDEWKSHHSPLLYVFIGFTLVAKISFLPTLLRFRCSPAKKERKGKKEREHIYTCMYLSLSLSFFSMMMMMRERLGRMTYHTCVH